MTYIEKLYSIFNRIAQYVIANNSELVFSIENDNLFCKQRGVKHKYSWYSLTWSITQKIEFFLLGNASQLINKADMYGFTSYFSAKLSLPKSDCYYTLRTYCQNIESLEELEIKLDLLGV